MRLVCHLNWRTLARTQLVLTRMSYKTRIEFSRQIERHRHSSLVIICNFPSFFIHSTLDYIMKPISKSRVFISVSSFFCRKTVPHLCIIGFCRIFREIFAARNAFPALSSQQSLSIFLLRKSGLYKIVYFLLKIH